jgi:DNA-binding response OmpR family regulator
VESIERCGFGTALEGYIQPVTSGRVLIAEEDPTLRRILADRLEVEGYEVLLLDTPDRLGEASDHFDADVVVISVTDHGPRLQRVREQSDVLFVAMLPCTTGLFDALDVIDAGADDALVKPFSPRELVTRMRALLRRRTSAADERPLLFDGLAIDPAAREVTAHGRRIELPAREFDLLVFLASSPRQVFTRTQIMAHVWGIEDGLGSATVTEHIRRLRSRIEPDPMKPRWIQTVWSVGYRFTP